MSSEQATRRPNGDTGRPPPPEREIDSTLLLGSRPEVRIRHNDLVYTLRRTRQGKLILTK